MVGLEKNPTGGAKSQLASDLFAGRGSSRGVESQTPFRSAGLLLLACVFGGPAAVWAPGCPLSLMEHAAVWLTWG